MDDNRPAGALTYHEIQPRWDVRVCKMGSRELDQALDAFFEPFAADGGQIYLRRPVPRLRATTGGTNT